MSIFSGLTAVLTKNRSVSDGTKEKPWVAVTCGVIFIIMMAFLFVYHGHT